MRCGTASGDKVVRQTHKYWPYQPGKSQLIMMTGAMGAPKTNVRKRIGYFDTDDGVYFEQSNGTINIVLRTSTSGSVVNTPVPQSDWNLDTFDGSEDYGNPNGLSIDISFAQIFFIDLQWLGVGRVRFGFVIRGVPLYCHEILNANLLTTVYMKTAALPVRYEIENTGVSVGNTDMWHICSTVVSEGGFEIPAGFKFAASNKITSIGVTTRRAILTIRPKAIFNSLTNRGIIIPISWGIIVTTNDAFVELVRNGTLGGTPSWASAGDNSIMEYDVAGTTVTGGDVICKENVPADQGNFANNFSDTIKEEHLAGGLAVDFDNNQDTLSLVITSHTGTTNVNGSLCELEVYQ